MRGRASRSAISLALASGRRRSGGSGPNGSPCSPCCRWRCHLGWQVAALKPDDGADALAKFRSNRFAGLLMFARLPGGGHRLRLLLRGRALYLAADAQRQ